jgi:3-oxoacyl-[acyl-carrier protein] reductase
VDILVNNAGVAMDGVLGTFSDDDVDSVVDLNVKGTIAMTKAAIRSMLRQRSGLVINISSIVGLSGYRGLSVYGATKAALMGFTKSLARELASRNIRVNAVSPGFIDTDMTAGLNAELKAKMTEAIPLGRLGTADEVARTVLFLASDAASYVTGEVLKVNGGMYM